MKNVVIVIAIAFVVILCVALYYEREENKQISKERDNLLDIAKKSSTVVKEEIDKASKVSSDILISLKDKMSEKAEELLSSDELLKFKDDLQEIVNNIQSDVETKIDELKSVSTSST